MKNISLLVVTILAVVISFAALVVSNPLIIMVVALSFMLVGFYSYGFTFAFLGGIIYSLCSQAPGSLSLFSFSVVLIAANLLFLKMRETIHPNILFNILTGSVLLTLTHFLFFKQFLSGSLAVAFLLFFGLNLIFYRKL